MDGLELFGKPEEQLAAVNQAIYAVLKGGQSYQIGSRKLTRADLDLLWEMQRKLQAAVANEEESPLFGDTVVAVFDRR
ncbi:MAG: peptidylprolyl isomerase [Hungatella sp.]